MSGLPVHRPAAALAAAERALMDAHDGLAERIAGQALNEMGGAGDQRLAARLLCTRAVAVGNLGRPAEAAALAQRARDAAARAGDPLITGHAAAIAAFNLAEDGHGTRAVGALLEAMTALDACGEPGAPLVNALVMVAQAAIAVGDHHTARSFIDRAVASGHAVRDPAAQAHAMSADLRLRVREALDAERRSAGAARRAHEQVVEAGGPTLAMCDSAGDVAAAIEVRALLALSLASIGESARADRRLGEVARLCADHDLPSERIVHLARGRALLERGAAREALAVLDDALRTPLDDIAGDRSSWIHQERARALEALGEVSAAVGALREALTAERAMLLGATARLGDAISAHLRPDPAGRRARHDARGVQRAARDTERDGATGALTRHAFQARMDAVAASGTAWVLVVIDVDRFTRLNERFGHRVGDDVLATVARLIGAACRRDDPVGRCAGGELVVGLPGATRQEGEACAHRIAAAVRSYPWSTVAPGLSISVSVGVAAATGSGSSHPVLERPGGAPHGAEEAGRDTVPSAPARR